MDEEVHRLHGRYGVTVTPEALDDFFVRFDAPADDEEVIVYTGDLGVLVSALTKARGR